MGRKTPITTDNRRNPSQELLTLGLSNTYCDCLLRFTVISLCIVSASAIPRCDPKDSSTCKFMGKCVSSTLLNQYNPWIAISNFHMCTCPAMSCYKLERNVVCASDGEKQRTFYNDMCMRLQECELQKPLKRICRGICGEANCRPFDNNHNHKNCPEEKEDYCHNGGLCLISRDGPSDPFCRCLRGYTGPRCKRKSLFNTMIPQRSLQR